MPNRPSPYRPLLYLAIAAALILAVLAHLPEALLRFLTQINGF